MFATTLFGCFSLTFFPLIYAYEDFLYQTVPRRFFELPLLLELGFYLWRFFFVRVTVSTEFLLLLCLSLPLLAFSLLSRGTLGLDGTLSLLCLGLGVGFHRLLFLLTTGLLSTVLPPPFLLCRRFGRPKKVRTEHIPLLPFFLLPTFFCLFSLGKALS